MQKIAALALALLASPAAATTYIQDNDYYQVTLYAGHITQDTNGTQSVRVTAGGYNWVELNYGWFGASYGPASMYFIDGVVFALSYSVTYPTYPFGPGTVYGRLNDTLRCVYDCPEFHSESYAFIAPTQTPLPSALLLFATGLLALGGLYVRRG